MSEEQKPTLDRWRETLERHKLAEAEAIQNISNASCKLDGNLTAFDVEAIQDASDEWLALKNKHNEEIMLLLREAFAMAPTTQNILQ